MSIEYKVRAEIKNIQYSTTFHVRLLQERIVCGVMCVVRNEFVLAIAHAAMKVTDYEVMRVVLCGAVC